MGAFSSTLDLLAQTEQGKLAKFFSRTFVIGGVASGIASYFDSSSGLFTSWDNYFTAITSTLYVVSGLMIYLRPKWLVVAVLLSIIPSAIYQHGVMFLAVHHPNSASLYSAASSGPFFPLTFVVLFIALPRGASTLSWIHCAGFYVQWIMNATWLSESLPTPGRFEAEHLLVEAMMAYPIYILALNYIVKLRERLHAAQEEVFQHKESFLGMLSHEIRNQLQTMVGALELLDFKLKDPAERRSVHQLQSATTQLQTYLSDINELTKLENPTLSIEKKPFNLTQLLDDLSDEWLPYALNRGLQLTTIAPGTWGSQPLLADTDKARLRQVISNLISNAIKYTDVGNVTIKAGACIDLPGHFKVEVIDTGIGIDKKHLDTIFLPHVRLDDLGRRTDGSGLGLAIVKRLVSSLGGSLKVESHLHHGSTFQLTVPGLVRG